MKQTGFMTYAAGALAALGLMALAAPGAWAQANTATDAAVAADAEVIIGITITETASLNFGSFSAGSGGTVRIDTDGGANPTGTNLVMVPGTGNTPQAAAFNITGEPDFFYSITLPSSAVELEGQTGAAATGPQTMNATSFTAKTTSLGADGVDNAFLDGSGDDDFTVGATLGVASAQAQGTYLGSFSVTVTYD